MTTRSGRSGSFGRSSKKTRRSSANVRGASRAIRSWGPQAIAAANSDIAATWQRPSRKARSLVREPRTNVMYVSIPASLSTAFRPLASPCPRRFDGSGRAITNGAPSAATQSLGSERCSRNAPSRPRRTIETAPSASRRVSPFWTAPTLAPRSTASSRTVGRRPPTVVVKRRRARSLRRSSFRIPAPCSDAVNIYP